MKRITNFFLSKCFFFVCKVVFNGLVCSFVFSFFKTFAVSQQPWFVHYIILGWSQMFLVSTMLQDLDCLTDPKVLRNQSFCHLCLSARKSESYLNNDTKEKTNNTLFCFMKITCSSNLSYRNLHWICSTYGNV